MKIQPQLTYKSVSFDMDTEAYLVVSLVAPAIEWQTRRPKVCVIPTIDISGSMSGPKLDYAKKAALKLVDQLAPGDYAGLVTFSDSGRIDFAPREMSPGCKEELKAAIRRVKVEGGTNFSDGLIKALEAAKRLDLSAAIITRVVMLTDGQPTHGIAKDSKSLNLLLGAQLGHVSLSAFGFGSDPDQALLSSLAETGKGNYAYIQDPDNALAAFGKELGGLMSTYAQSIDVVITPSKGHMVTEVISDVEVDREVDGEVSVKIPSILAEETASIVVGVRLSSQKQPSSRQVNAFGVKVRFQYLGEDGSLLTEEVEADAKVQFVPADSAQGRPTKEVDELVARAQLVRAQIEADQAAQRGDFESANRVFQVASSSFDVRGHVALQNVTNYIGGAYSSQLYGSTSGRRTALRSATSRGTGVSSMAADDEEALKGASYTISNSAQDSMSAHFTGAPVSNPDVSNPNPDSAGAPAIPRGAPKKVRSKAKGKRG